LKFEREMLEAVVHNEDLFFVSQQIEAAIPEVASVMKAGFSCTNSLLKTMNTNISSNFEDLKRENAMLKSLLADTLLSVGARLKEGSNTEAEEEILNLAPTEANVMENDGLNSQAYKMNRHFVSVVDVWREYKEGILGKPSVESLERNFGVAWRKDRAVSRFFCRRNVLYNEIKKIALNNNISCEEAAVVLENRRVELKVSLDKLSKMLAKK
jgi:hypothetical protein